MIAAEGVESLGKSLGKSLGRSLGKSIGKSLSKSIDSNPYMRSPAFQKNALLHYHSTTTSWLPRRVLNPLVNPLANPLVNPLVNSLLNPLVNPLTVILIGGHLRSKKRTLPLPLDHCIMVAVEGFSTRARKSLPELNHHFHAVLIGRSAPFLREMLFRHVEFDVRWNGSNRISIARATCTFN